VFREADSTGLDGVLVKPVSPSLLFDAAMRALGDEDHRLTPPGGVLPIQTTETSVLARLQGARVLVVEDNELNQQVAFELLGAAGITVDVAENGSLGVQRAQETSYDLVLMDLQMPVMDGWEAARRIRALPGLARLPILAMTANALAGDRDRSLAAGMNDHVTKPIDPEELFEVLLRWLPHRTVHAPAECETAADVSSPSAVAGPALDLIPGLDTADGLRRVLGRREAYVGILRRFAVGHADVTRDIRAALAEGRRADAERRAHTLKGAAGTIGARELQRQAGEIEAALRQGATPKDVEPLLDTAGAILDDLVSALLRTLPSEPELTSVTSSVDAKVLAAAVGRLDRLLSSDAAEAVDAFEAAGPILAAAFGERAGQIGKLVRSYQFEEALAALREVTRG
jgi:two-component system sensor histidine kinase/response regulator